MTFVRENYVHHLVSQIEQVHVQSSKELVLESLVIALQSLVDNNEMATEIVKSSNELKCSLQEIIKSVTGNDQYLVRNLFLYYYYYYYMLVFKYIMITVNAK